ncbi:MAG TPA: NYN domain-containing protein [Pseudogracilibacillus sp.]|nr:NYN domain-containing protein [Pseudogracilibacillus sp.]
MDVLVVDGYNIIGAWDELIKLREKDIAQARKRLIERMQEYQAYSKNRVIIVFDALYVQGTEHRQFHNGVEVIYTQENETADECIERLVKSLKHVDNEVYVATSDYMEQRTIFSRGALRMPARELLLHIEHFERTIPEQIESPRSYNGRVSDRLDKKILLKLEEMRRRGKR